MFLNCPPKLSPLDIMNKIKGCVNMVKTILDNLTKEEMIKLVYNVCNKLQTNSWIYPTHNGDYFLIID